MRAINETLSSLLSTLSDKELVQIVDHVLIAAIELSALLTLQFIVAGDRLQQAGCECAYAYGAEFSHQFAGLADEYYSFAKCNTEAKPEPWRPNVTANASREGLKWAGLSAPSISLPSAWNKKQYEEYDASFIDKVLRHAEGGDPDADMDAYIAEAVNHEIAMLRAESLFGQHRGNFYLCLRIAREQFLHGKVNNTRAGHITNPLITESLSSAETMGRFAADDNADAEILTSPAGRTIARQFTFNRAAVISATVYSVADRHRIISELGLGLTAFYVHFERKKAIYGFDPVRALDLLEPAIVLTNLSVEG